MNDFYARAGFGAIADAIAGGLGFRHLLPPRGLAVEWMAPGAAQEGTARACWGAIALEHPWTIRLASDAHRAPHGPEGVVAHETAHVGQLLGWLPTDGDLEALPRALARDFGGTWDGNPARNFEERLRRAVDRDTWRAIRRGEFARAVSGAWDRSAIWQRAFAQSAPEPDVFEVVTPDGGRFRARMRATSPETDGRQTVEISGVRRV